jgi:hypothetical protein
MKLWGKTVSIGPPLFGLLTTIALVLGLAAVPAKAQTSTAGTVTGQVTDESGAAVPGAAVKVTELATGEVQATITNEAGRYTFPAVNPGTYNVTFAKDGFSTYEIKSQTIDIGFQLTLNAKMKIGSTSTTVEVTASIGAELQTMNATVGNTLSGRSLLVLPNLGRDVTSMAVLQPATTPSGYTAGTQYDENTYQLDGANITDDMGGNVITYQTNYSGLGGSQGGGIPSGEIPTPIESIEEFKVSVANQTSDFNNSSGGQVQMSTKRGTNQFHGAAYMFYFDSAIGEANSWGNNHTPLTFGTQTFPDTPVDFPKNHRSRFGGALGGPLIPKPFLGSGKWYFFSNEEFLRFPNVGLANYSVPSPALRSGIIQLPNAAGVYTPYNITGSPVMFNGSPLAPAACSTPSGACDPRATTGINPIVNSIWSTQIPQGNNPLGGDTYNTLGYVSSISAPLTSNNYVGRIDHDFSEKQHFYVTYRDFKLVSLTTNQVDIGGVLPGDKLGTPTAKAPRPQQPSVWIAGLTSVINPTTTNAFVFSYLRNFWQWSDSNGPPEGFGLGGNLEISGETSSPGLIPYNVNTQSIRQRFWDGHDTDLRDDITSLHGNHLFTFGGAYAHNWDYHSRTDNGAGVNNQISYLSTDANISFTPTTGVSYVPSTVTSGQTGNFENYYSYLTGMLSSTQVMYTRTGPTLTPEPVGTPAFDKSTIPYYSVYWQDSWHVKPSFTLTYGLGWNLEMPPTEQNGKQVEIVDSNDQPISTTSFLANRQNAALQGGNYIPTVGFSLIGNLGGSPKYPYNPYYGEFSPRVSFAWNPHYSDGLLGKLFGNGKTVLRGGYSRIFGRLNGVDLVLVPLLGPGLLQGVTCIGPLTTGACGTGTSNPATAFRIGVDGLTAPLAAPTPTLSQPYYPGGTNPETVDSESLDPNFKPSRTDNFTFTLQRELNSHVHMEVGYIGKIIRNDYMEVNLDAVPTMETLGGQSFSNAFAQLYSQLFFNGVSAANVTAQPFFENALGGGSSAFCKGYSSCTVAVASTYASQMKDTEVGTLWNKLQAANGWQLGKTTYGFAPAGTGFPQSTSLGMITSLGFGNYNALFVSLRTSSWHGLTANSNFTWGRGLGSYTSYQATSSETVLNPYNMASNYGPAGSIDYKALYNLSLYYDVPFYKTQKGVIGHIVGGWTISPLFTANSGAPSNVSYTESSGGGQTFGEVTTPGTSNVTGINDGSAVGFSPYTGGNSVNYNIGASSGSNIVYGASAVNTKPISGSNPALYGVNQYTNPGAIYGEFRPCVLGLDTSCGYNDGPRGPGTWNLDTQFIKDIGIYKERVGTQLFVTMTNITNHTQMSGGSRSLSSPTTFGQIGSQSNSPRAMEFGVRIRF